MNAIVAVLLAALVAAAPGNFQARMRALVGKGNRAYELSDRQGIRAAIDSLEMELEKRSQEGRLHPVDSLEYQADIYKLKGDLEYENGSETPQSYALARQYFQMALDIYNANENIFGQDADKKPMIWRELAQLYYKQGLYQEAYDMLCSAQEADDQAPLDLQAQKAICLARLGKAAQGEALVDEVLASLEKEGEAYYETLRKKGKIILLSGADDRGKQALPLYQSYFQWKKQDALEKLLGMTPTQRQDYWMRMRPFVTDCFQLEGASPGFLFDVAIFSKGLLLQLNLLDKDPGAIGLLDKGWADIQKALPPESCAIEYIQYEKDGHRRMGAVVVPSSGEPVWVNLMDPDAFYSYSVFNARVDQILSSGGTGNRKAGMYGSEDLARKLWPQALSSAIGESRSVYFSPDGYLQQIAVEYMGKMPEMLQDKIFFRLSSTRELLRGREMDLSSALVVGGVNFDAQVDAPAVGENDAAALDYLRIKIRKGGLDPLKNSHKEARQVIALRSSPEDTLILSEKATEAALRSLLGNYHLLHLATHGCYFAKPTPKGSDLKPCLRDESLSQSFLALAGANTNAREPGFDASCLDGVLSAAEIARLDLRKVNLAVISACESGLGEVSADGIYGIQRGLKDAGAGCLIISLWEVSDQATYQLMVNFYSGLAKGMSIKEAFSTARKGFLNAWDRNAFILIDALL